MKFVKAFVICCLMFCGWLGAHVAEAKVVLPAMFGDNMVLQQKARVRFFGKANPGKVLTVMPSWGNNKYSTKIDQKGNWQLDVPTPVAGYNFTIIFNDGEPLQLQNILVGEVWLASGQSNMQMSVSSSLGNVLNHEQEIASAHYPNIRYLHVERVNSPVPLSEVKANKGWEVCSPATVADFSAVAYFFARNLHKNLNVPIGIIHASWGGTDIEAWISRSSLKTIPDFVPALERIKEKQLSEAELQEEYAQELARVQQNILAKDAGYAQGKAVWADPKAQDQDWKQMKLPSFWDTDQLPGFDGVVWFRKKITLPAAWAGQDLKVNIGPIDDDETTWFNGEQIGQTIGYAKNRQYAVPARLVKAGENVITVRVVDNGGDGGINGPQAAMFLLNSAGEKLSLEGDWRYKATVDLSTFPPLPRNPLDRNRLTGNFNAMIHPFLSIPIKGVIWYQGENNAGRAHQYQTLFPLLIKDWRKQFKNEDLPFYYVQLANYKEPRPEPGASDWAELREAQLLTLSVPNTGMAVAIDAGEANNIHPRNKQVLGERLALLARAKTYGEEMEYSGPQYKSMTRQGNRIKLTFDHVTGGLKAKDGQLLKGFSIAGPDKKFYWADAQIVGDEVLVPSPQVPEPVAVRYGWANNPDATLYNKAGLPASPFRTDSWPGITVGKK